jgi:CheY-like chemotaxis protein
MTGLGSDLAEGPGGPRRTILVVEDQVLVRMLTVDALRDLGFRVEEAGTAREALGKVGALVGRIDAAVIDLGLPDRPGDALAADLRARFASLPIVIASGYGADLRHGLGDDALVGFLDKPYDGAQLAALLSRLGVRTGG